MTRKRRRGLGEEATGLARPACKKAWDAAERMRAACVAKIQSGGQVHAGWAFIAGPCVSAARLAQKAAEGGRCDLALNLAEKAGRAAARFGKKAAVSTKRWATEKV